MVIRGEKRANVELYKPDGILTKSDKERAIRIDEMLEREFRRIEKDFKKNGLLDKKGTRKGVVELWWEVGKRLRFIEDLGLNEDERKYIWQAMFDHAGGITPKGGSERARTNPESSHFAFCYMLASLEKEMALRHEWTFWFEFLDSEPIRKDRRILMWLSKRAMDWYPGGSKQEWVRNVAKAIRNGFNNINTRSLDEEELERELERITSS